MLALALALALTGQADALSQINAIRASYSLPAVTWDATAEATSQANNGQQVIRGMGHYVADGPQNSAMAADTASAFSAWMQSDGHKALILNPSLVAIGYAQNGPYHTLTGRAAYQVVSCQESISIAPGACQGPSYRFRASYRQRAARHGLARALFGP